MEFLRQIILCMLDGLRRWHARIPSIDLIQNNTRDRDWKCLHGRIHYLSRHMMIMLYYPLNTLRPYYENISSNIISEHTNFLNDRLLYYTMTTVGSFQSNCLDYPL